MKRKPYMEQVYFAGKKGYSQITHYNDCVQAFNEIMNSLNSFNQADLHGKAIILLEDLERFLVYTIVAKDTVQEMITELKDEFGLI